MYILHISRQTQQLKTNSKQTLKQNVGTVWLMIPSPPDREIFLSVHFQPQIYRPIHIISSMTDPLPLQLRYICIKDMETKSMTWTIYSFKHLRQNMIDSSYKLVKQADN